jgi:hypothetical protein
MQLYSPAPTDCRECVCHSFWVAGGLHICQFKHISNAKGIIPPMIDGRLKESQGQVLAGWTDNQPITPPESCPRHTLPAKESP